MAVFLNRAWSDGEHNLVGKTPWQIFADRRSFVPLPAVASGYTHPTLSNARLTSLSSTGGYPAVDYTF